MYRCDSCGYGTYEKSLYSDDLCIYCRKGNPILLSEEEMKEIKETEKKSIALVIAFLRMLTHGEGNASVRVFDAGSGGGFSDASVYLDLLRSGMTLEAKEIYSIKELYDVLEKATWPYSDNSKGFYPYLKRYYEETLAEIEK